MSGSTVSCKLSGKVSRVSIFVLLSVLSFVYTSSADMDHITWYHADFPPGFINEGEMAGDGYENYLERTLREGMPDFTHSYQSANYSRILEQIRNTNACCVALVRTPEREKFIEFSRPTMIAMPNGVFVRSDRIDEFKPYINDEGYISFHDLFDKSDLKVGISKGRKYKGEIDRILEENKGSSRIVVREGKDVLRGLLLMMSKGRDIDYVVGYPHELNWLNYVKTLRADVTFIPIKEMPKYVVSYIGCTKNGWGKRVIKRINSILGSNYDGEYKKRYQKFLAPEAVKLHEMYFKEVFSSD